MNIDEIGYYERITEIHEHVTVAVLQYGVVIKHAEIDDATNCYLGNRVSVAKIDD